METNPWDDFQSVIQRAQNAQQKGDNELAYEFFARASELNPDAAEGWRGRAATATIPDDALVSIGYAVALQPEDAAQKQTLEQLIEIRNASATPEDAPALIVMGEKLAEVGLTRQAQTLLRRAVELDDHQEEGLIWFAATTEDPTDATRALKQVLDRNPQHAVAQAGLEEIERQLHTAAGPAPTETEAVPESATPTADPVAELVRQGEQLLASMEKARAYQIFVHATEISPRNEGAWMGRARAADDIDEALTCLEQVIAINPGNNQAREARTFYRVRKLREGMRKTPEPAPEPERPTPAFVPSQNPDRDRSPQPKPPAKQPVLRLVLIALVVIVLLAVLAMFFLMR